LWKLFQRRFQPVCYGIHAGARAHQQAVCGLSIIFDKPGKQMQVCHALVMAAQGNSLGRAK